MGKVTSLNGKVTGKIGGVVYSTNAGAIIAREYNPNVANPNTAKQVDQRAKMKLMSQIAAALAPVIVIPKEGLKSSRNLFIKKNFDQASAHEGVAQITYENVQLTNGNAGIPAIYATRFPESGVQIQLAERCDASISRVVYIMYKKTSEATLQYVQSVIAEAPGDAGTFPATMLYIEGDIVLFCYGMKDLNTKATAKYSNYGVHNAEDIAQLAMARTISYSDYQFTQTRGTTMFAGENETMPVGGNQARVYLTKQGNGQVSGAGVYDLGTQVSVTATPAADNAFVGWKLNGSESIISTNATYTFTLKGMTDLVAVFRSTLVESFSVNLTASPVEGGSVSGGGQFDAGASCTAVATAAEGFNFVGWKKNGKLVSNAPSYTFVVSEATSLVAEFAEITSEGGFSNVTLNGAALTQETTTREDPTIAGSVDDATETPYIALIKSDSVPSGVVSTTSGNRAEVASNGQFSKKFYSLNGGKYYIVGGTLDGDNLTIKSVYPTAFYYDPGE